jgi:hypothetical protein
LPNTNPVFCLKVLSRLTHLIGTVLPITAAFLASATAGAQTIRVEPNILVSRESALPKMQMMVVADPNDAKHLLGTAIAATPVEDVVTVYVSFDGGYSWRAVVPPGLPDTGSGDPQVVFGNRGTAYFSTLGLVPDASKRPHFVVMLYRSQDGGLSWERIVDFGSGSSPDHDMAVVDNAGRLFISVVYTAEGRDNVGIYRLDPGETSVHGPIRVATAAAGTMLFNWNPLTLSDGTLFVPFEVTHGPVGKAPEREIFAAISRDGGVTFSSGKRIGAQTLNHNNPVNPYGNVTFAADGASTRFQDRLYMVWNESDGGADYRLKFAHSTDAGDHWSAPRSVAAGNARHANAFHPVVAVNPLGVIGVSWLDTRESLTGRTYRELFTASVDGGETFGTPVAVSSAWSSLDDPANYAFHPTIDSPRRAPDGSIEFSFDTTLGRAPDGGDFMGLAADASGAFHPFWIDTRTGTFQVWTSAVRAGQLATDGLAEAAEPELNRRLRPLFDPATYDAATGAETIPVRLQNISGQPVCAPVFAIVEDPEAAPHPTPRILNAGNHKDWAGAYFDYSSAFRDLPCLAPGQITEAVPWRVQPLRSERTFVTLRFTLSHERPGR